MNALVRDAVAEGVDPADALAMATLNAATWHGLAGLGAVAPAHRADLLVLPDLERFVPDLVLTAGRPPGEIAPAPVPEWVRHTVRIAPITLGDLRIPWQDGDAARVIGIVPGQIVTEALTEAPTVARGAAVADPERDLAKIAVVERHLGTGRIGLGLVRGLGLRHGAIASTIAHDAHNIVCVGVDDGDMARAVQRLAELGGGMVVVRDRGIRAELPLPVAGLLSDAPLERVLDADRRGLGSGARARNVASKSRSTRSASSRSRSSPSSRSRTAASSTSAASRSCRSPWVAESRSRPAQVVLSASATGSPAAFHAWYPPIMSPASSMPRSTSVAAARLEANPSSHITMTGPVRVTTSGSSQPDVGSTRHSTMFRDMTIAPGITPSARRCS